MRTLRLALWVFAASVVAACSGGDPGGGNSGGDGTPSLGASGGSSGGASSNGGAPASTKDAAPPPPSDPVVPGTPVSNPQDAFTGAPAYQSKPPSIRANDQHGGTPVTGKPCLACHDGVTCTKFDFAGTVWKAPAKTTGAADVEVRIIDANDMAYSVHSDVDGNFWHRADTDLALPALSGARTANFHAIGKLNGTSCNVCHQPTNDPPGRLFVE